MDDDVTEVEEYPFSLVSALASDSFQFEVFTESFLNRIGQSLDMRTRGTGGDYENVRENKLLFDIKNRDV